MASRASAARRSREKASVTLFKRLFARDDERGAVRSLYAAITARARLPHWYIDGAVPDTIDGRFEMVALLLSLVLIRLEALGDAAAAPAARLTETFVDDMDGQLRELGMGDVVVGKHIGKMMSALGGRIGAYRIGLSDAAVLGDALVRNLYAGVAPAETAQRHVSAQVARVSRQLGQRALPALLAGDIGS
jgi:cytochrome b pre-mRNA-processing protein 3